MKRLAYIVDLSYMMGNTVDYYKDEVTPTIFTYKLINRYHQDFCCIAII